MQVGNFAMPRILIKCEPVGSSTSCVLKIQALMEPHGNQKMQGQNVFLSTLLAAVILVLLVIGLSACSATAAQPAIVVDEHAPKVGGPAKVVTTANGDIYAFSFIEDGQKITCHTPVKPNTDLQTVPHDQWRMVCTKPHLQETAQPIPVRKLDIPSDALFEFGKSGIEDMKPKGRRSLEQFAQLLHDDYSQQPQLILTGHTDRLGSAEANHRISLARAQSVAELLRRSGIARDQITVLGKGSAEPIAECPGTKATPQLIRCLQPNRRVGIEIIGN